MDLTISKDNYEKILKKIESEDSPVGIDAGKTHVLILQKLLDIECRLEKIESSLQQKR